MMLHNQQDVSDRFKEVTGHAPTFMVRAPGRINIIGEHVDYNEGIVLPGAIDKALYFALRPNGTSLLRYWALDIDAYAEAPIDTLPHTDALWMNYLLGIADQFQRLGHQLQGLDVVFGGDLPIGAGVSASAALECGMALAWNHLLKAGLDGPELAQLAQRSSHTFIGIPCGIMDQFASLNGQSGHAILLDCRTLEYQPVPIAVEGCTWVLLNTRVSHVLAQSEYPQRVAECKEGLQVLQAHFPQITAFREATPAQVEQLKGAFKGKVYQRVRFVVGEHLRTLAMMEALSKGDATGIGQLLNLTHIGLSEDYEVSCPELDFLFTQALKHPDVLGARMMGGGFGGCTLNLVRTDALDHFTNAALTAYEAAFGKQGDSLVVHIADGAGVID
ncbi:MAG: galactokinase [Saprospiraceae bacterium]